MILAAGLGTRLGEMTKNTPKALVEVRGVSLIENVATKLVSQGFGEIVVNLHHFPEKIISFLESNHFFGAEMKFSVEKDFPLGTGGGIFFAAELLKDSETFLVHNVDVISDTDLKSLFDSHLRLKNDATLSVKKRETTRPLLFEKGGTLLRRLTEGEEINSENSYVYAFSGIQCISSSVLEKKPPSSVFSIIDFYLENKQSVKTGYSEDIGNYWFDAGKPEILRHLENNPPFKIP